VHLSRSQSLYGLLPTHPRGSLVHAPTYVSQRAPRPLTLAARSVSDTFQRVSGAIAYERVTTKVLLKLDFHAGCALVLDAQIV